MKFIEKAQNDSTTMWLVVIVSFLLGIVVGFLFAPIKKGMKMFSNNTIIGNGDDDDEEDDWNDGYDEDEVVEF